MPLHEFFKQARKVVEKYEPFPQPQGPQPIDPESELYCKLVHRRCVECDAPTTQIDHVGDYLCDKCYDACTCSMTPVNCTTIDPPERKRNRFCPVHGNYDEDADRDRMNEKTNYHGD